MTALTRTAKRATRAQLLTTIDDLKAQCFLLAKLAADTPKFNNPYTVSVAKMLRDKWLEGAA